MLSEHGPIEAGGLLMQVIECAQYSMLSEHGPIEAGLIGTSQKRVPSYSMLSEHGPIEAFFGPTNAVGPSIVFHALRAWPH
jgi:hypothetical protein